MLPTRVEQPELPRSGRWPDELTSQIRLPPMAACSAESVGANTAVALMAPTKAAVAGVIAVEKSLVVARPMRQEELSRPSPQSPLESSPTSSNFHSSESNATQPGFLVSVNMRTTARQRYLQPIAAIAAVGLDWPPSRQSSR